MVKNPFKTQCGIITFGFLINIELTGTLGYAQSPEKDSSATSQPSSIGMGASPSTSPTPTTNEASNKAQQILKNVLGLFPKRIVLLETAEAEEVPELFNMGDNHSKTISYFEIANSPDLAWETKINYKKFAKLDAIKATFLISGADTLVHMPKDGDWTLYRKTSSTAKGKILSRPGPSQRDLSTVVNWIFEALNWDGVVLGQDGETLLVGSSEKMLQGTQLQALAVAKSHSKFSLTATERKGSGLLSLEKSEGGIGYFTVVLLGAGVKSFPVGTKLIIEKKKAK